MKVYCESQIEIVAGAEVLEKLREYVNADDYPRILERETNVKVSFPGLPVMYADILKTHLIGAAVTYDFIITFPTGETTRMYNIQSCFVSEVKLNRI